MTRARSSERRSPSSRSGTRCRAAVLTVVSSAGDVFPAQLYDPDARYTSAIQPLYIGYTSVHLKRRRPLSFALKAEVIEDGSVAGHHGHHDDAHVSAIHSRSPLPDSNHGHSPGIGGVPTVLNPNTAQKIAFVFPLSSLYLPFVFPLSFCHNELRVVVDLAHTNGHERE